MGRNKRMATQLDCFGKSPRNDVKQKTFPSLQAAFTPSLRAAGEAIQKKQFIRRNRRMVTQLECFGQCPCNDVKRI